jgi:methylmalonyl-CoA mutase N-terminal domain/subunit
VFRLDPAAERAQLERLRALRASRSESETSERLSAVGKVARGGENLMPAILAAAEASATVGEISDRLREVFGEYRETAA